MYYSLIFLVSHCFLFKKQSSGIFIKEAIDTSFAVGINHQIESVQTKILFAQHINTVLCVAFMSLFLILLGFQFKNAKVQQKANQIIYNRYQVAMGDLDKLQKISQQRQKTSKEFHQNIGSQLAYISSSLDNLKCLLAGKYPEVENKLSAINLFAKNSLEDFRDSVWALQQENISLEELKIRLTNFIVKSGFLEQDIYFSIEMEEALLSFKFDLFDGISLYKILKEAILYAIKEKNATRITLQIIQKNNQLEIVLQDNVKEPNKEYIQSHLTFKFNLKRKVSEIGASMNMIVVSTGTKLLIVY